MIEERTDDGKFYYAEDQMSMEVEVIQFIRALVGLIQPDLIVETGHYHGTLTKVLVQAMDDDSCLETCDINIEYHNELAKWLGKMGRFPDVKLHLGTGIQMITSIHERREVVDLAILDSSGDRLEETRLIRPLVRTGGFIVIHDSYRPNEAAAVRWLKTMGFSIIQFPTPRGLAIACLNR